MDEGNGIDGWMDGGREWEWGERIYIVGLEKKEILKKKKKKNCLRGRMEDFFLKFFVWLNNYRGRVNWN